MSGLNYQRESVLYSNPDAQVKIYKGYLTHNRTPVAIKEELHLTLADANASINEALIMSRVKHPGAVDVYGCELQQVQAEFMSVIVVELLESDLYKQVQHRASVKAAWSEGELIVYLETLIGVLAAAQQQGISHRDIKPQNIFCRQDGSDIKLGDFGASKSLLGAQMTATLKGSPFYLSPQLKQKYAIMVSGGTSEDYNPFKSDVYSLGVTFLFLARLKAPTEMMGSLQDLEMNTNQIIGELQGNFPTLTRILPSMLAFHEPLRCDFLQLQEMWNQMKSALYPPQPESYQNPMGYPSQPQAAQTWQPANPYPHLTTTVQPQAYHPQVPLYNTVQPQASPQVPLYNTVQSQGYPQAPFGYPVQPQVASPAYNYNQGLQQGPPNPLFYTVQPQVPAPLPPLAEVHSSMAGALAAAQSVRICEICKNPFMDARMGRYCSLGCLQQANKQPAQFPPQQPAQFPPQQPAQFPPQQPAQFPPQQPQQFMQRAMRKCTFCTNFVTSTLTLVPPHLRHFEKFASEVCSVGCLEKFEKVEEQEIDTPCLGCKGRGKISDSWAPTLPCGHRFHNKDCLFVYLQKVSVNFNNSNPNFPCSQCHKTFRLCDVLRYFNWSEFEQRKQTVLQSNCCVCNCPVVDRALRCGHMVCSDHRSGGGQMCRFCNSYQSLH